MRLDVIAQPIFVLPDQPLDCLIADAALAACSVIDWSAPSRDTEQWVKNDYRKTVRSAKNPDMLLRLHSEQEHMVSVGCALAGLPQAYGDFTKLMQKTQVSGWEDKPHAVSEHDRDSPFGTIILSEQVFMSPGKLAAQAAHSLMLYCLDQRPDTLDGNVLVRWGDVENGPYTVRDNGLTEIDEGTLTAMFILSDKC